MKDKIILDLDNTISLTHKKNYRQSKINIKLKNRISLYKKKGFKVIIYTSRNMNTFKENIDLIKKKTLPVIKNWLKKNEVPYDEIIVGKPWCGNNGFYVDDKAIRPSEFVLKNKAEINKILKQENKKNQKFFK